MKRPGFDLPTITSAGPQVLKVSDGSTYVKATPCGRCGEPIVQGERIAKVPSGWQHKVCSTETLASVPASRAWLALAADAARRPRDYKTGQLREILDAVLRIVYGAETAEHAAYVEALRHAYERQLADQRAGFDTNVDPHDFATRYAEFEWSQRNWDEERLAVELAYVEYVATATGRRPAVVAQTATTDDQGARAGGTPARTWDAIRFATAALGGDETPENRERAKQWVTELVTDAIGPEAAASLLPDSHDR